MDVSVVAAVGSFFMSERVLKPKATVLLILGMILAYDLTTKTHDVSSLRVYRGPALVAFTLLMSAFSLRTWRRNGVACDELLFLPGTAHGVNHGVTDSPPPSIAGDDVGGGAPAVAAGPVPESVVAHHTTSTAAAGRSEGDVAAGGPVSHSELELRRRSRSMELDHPATTNMETSNASHMKRGITMDEMRHNTTTSTTSRGDIEMTTHKVTTTKNTNNNNRSLRSDSFDSSLGWGSDEDEDDQEANHGEDQPLKRATLEEEDDVDGDQGCLREHTSLLCRSSTSIPEDQQQATTTENTVSEQPVHHNPLDLHHFREAHPRITRIGSFFFFRSPATSTQNAVYAPSGPAVVGAALDLSMPVLFNFHLFIEAFNHIKPKDADSEAPAKILPIIFLSVLIVRSLVPPGRRGRFWSTLKFTVMSPFHRVRFRDAFIGDVLTSMVRPGQDILFALSYYITVIWGSVSGKYGLTESGQLLESSWILHNVVLPSCALLPLWWRFLQTLRQAYDEEKRWPHLGNAFKYLTATLVILYGMTHPERKRSSYWIVLFLFSLAYQLWWDVVMDWDLLEIPPQQFRSELDALSVGEHWLFTNIAAIRPDSYILLALQRNVLTPLAEGWRRCKARLVSLQYVRLRSKRLYKSDIFYWRILAYNCAMRFTWMMCFIPAYRLSSSGEEKVATFSSDVNSYVGVLLPVAEIVRRCLWGLLLLERKTIQMTDGEEGGGPGYARLDTSGGEMLGEDSGESLHNNNNNDHDDDDDQRSGGDHSQTAKGGLYLPLWLHTAQQQMQHDTVNNSPLVDKLRSLIHLELGDDMKHNLFLAELGAWAAAFVGLGCWAAS